MNQALFDAADSHQIDIKTGVYASYNFVNVCYTKLLRGMIAYIVILYVSAFLNGTLSIRRLLIASKTKIPFAQWIFKPLLCIASSAVFVRLVFKFVIGGSAISAMCLTIKIILMIAVYILLLFITRCLQKDNVGRNNFV